MPEPEFVAVPSLDLSDLDTLVVPVFDDHPPSIGLPEPVAAVVSRMADDLVAAPRFATLFHYGAQGRVAVVKAGSGATFDHIAMRRLASAAIRSLWTTHARRVGFHVAEVPLPAGETAAATVDGVMFAMWRPELRSLESRDGAGPLPRLERVALATQDPGHAAGHVVRALAIARAVNVARRLANEPANRMTPSDVAAEAMALAADTGLECEVLDRAACEALGMGAFLSVAAGSAQPPAFIVLRHRGRGGLGHDLALVGKGITFDSGGISIKQQASMLHMKADMSGAAAVIGAMGAIATLDFAADVIGIAPCTENMPGGSATRPGDVFRSMNGVTVEVRNTDGEGRLALIDAVAYACREGARAVVDIATLTLSVAGAYGDQFVGAFGRPRAFVDRVVEAASHAGERFWPLPISDEIRDAIKSDVADITNSIGAAAWGGGPAGAAFIERGVEPGIPWVHLDLGMTYWSDVERPYSPKGPLGSGVRALVALAEGIAAA